MHHLTFDCQGVSFSRLWHCFGNHTNLADLQTVIGLLSVSQSNVLPINTHNLSEINKYGGLELGYKGVSLAYFESLFCTKNKTKMLNINLQTSAEQAVAKTMLAHSLTGEKIIKLEVLNDDLFTSNSPELVKAATQLIKQSPELMILPLFENDVELARQLIDAGCPLLRVMGSTIGGKSGIGDMAELEKICKLGVPVVLDGGLGNTDHITAAFEAGAEGVLVNSMLFNSDVPPLAVMKKVRYCVDRYFDSEDLQLEPIAKAA